ncbi:MAG TPA: hypothetical protein VIE39_07350 [Thermoanaerobaculia bacterium]|jgi:hypothetical protein
MVGLLPDPGRVRAARWLAVAADFLQIVALPFFLPGVASPWNNALDVGVAILMTRLVGWHWAFLPGFFAEMVPGLNIVPTWTAAVFYATRHMPASAPVMSAPPPPASTPAGGKVIDAEVVRNEGAPQ